MASWIPAVISAAGNIISNLFNTSQSNQSVEDSADLMRLQYGYNKDLYKYQFDTQTAYNSPSAQMARYSAAGLNPNLIYGSLNNSGSTASAGSVGLGSSTRLGASGSMFGDSAALINSMLTASQKDNIDAQTDLIRSQIPKTEAETGKTEAETASIEFQNRKQEAETFLINEQTDLLKKSKKFLVDAAENNATLGAVQIDIEKNYLEKVQPQELANLVASMNYTIAQTKTEEDTQRYLSALTSKTWQESFLVKFEAEREKLGLVFDRSTLMNSVGIVAETLKQLKGSNRTVKLNNIMLGALINEDNPKGFGNQLLAALPYIFQGLTSVGNFTSGVGRGISKFSRVANGVSNQNRYFNINNFY